MFWPWTSTLFLREDLVNRISRCFLLCKTYRTWHSRISCHLRDRGFWWISTHKRCSFDYPLPYSHPKTIKQRLQQKTNLAWEMASYTLRFFRFRSCSGQIKICVFALVANIALIVIITLASTFTLSVTWTLAFPTAYYRSFSGFSWRIKLHI